MSTNQKLIARVLLEDANAVSQDLESSKEYLGSLGLNVEESLSKGVKAIKQLRAKIKAEQVEEEQMGVFKHMGRAWEILHKLRSNPLFSFEKTAEEYDLALNFRNFEGLSENDKLEYLAKAIAAKLDKNDTP